VIAAGVITVWLDFLLLPITWLLAWLTCGVIIALGVYLFALSMKEFDRSEQRMPVPPSMPKALVTSGIYSSIRHPHYLTGLLFSFAFAIGFRSLIGLLITLVYVAVTYAFVLEEEKLLIGKFGEAYREYRARVPMFIPSLRRKNRPSP